MNSLELLLTFVFVVVIFLVVGNGIPSEMIIGVAALWVVIAWIGFDNMNMWDNFNFLPFSQCGFKRKKRVRFHKGIIDNEKKKEKKKERQKESMNNKKDINKNIDMNRNIDTEKKIKEAVESAFKESNVNKPEPKRQQPCSMTYSEDNYKYNLFDEIGCLGDNKLAHKMKQVSNKNREAMDNFSRTYTKYSNINYLEQELKDAAASQGWWDNEELEKEF